MTEVPFTPSIVVDLPTARRNLSTLLTYANKHNLKVRPHTKTHKSIRIAKMQLDAGCTGLTVAKIGEAETVGSVSNDLFLAYPALDPYRASHLAKIALTKSIRVGFDSATAAHHIGAAAKAAGATVGVLADIDVGHHRTGVQSPAELLALAQLIDKTPGLRLDGIMCYPGHIKGSDDIKLASLQIVQSLLEESISLFKKSGLNTSIVSGGSSPTCFLSHHVPAYTEIRPGTNIYQDQNQILGGVASVEDCAARVICTVVSDAVPNKFVIDAGSKSLTQDRSGYNPDADGFGHIVEFPHARITRLSEEHGEVNLFNSPTRPKIGDRVTVIPNHVCPCINLHDFVFFREDNGTLTQSPIDARGKVV